jgi:hypothetical protein
MTDMVQFLKNVSSASVKKFYEVLNFFLFNGAESLKSGFDFNCESKRFFII